MKHLLPAAVAIALLTQAPVFADNKVEIAAADTLSTLLPRLVGQKVELHLKNGEKLAGKLESVSAASVHLSSLAGQEFFDAVIGAGDISAVVVRMR